MNVYDFDNTIYAGDSTIDYYLFCLKRNPKMVRHLPSQLIKLIKYRTKQISKEEFKESIYYAIIIDSDFPGNITLFWDKHLKNIKSFYLSQKKESDLIISASPEFLIKEIGNRVGFEVIASRINTETGRHDDGINCHGKRKVERLYEIIKEPNIEEFYSDSLSDTPLANLAKKAYLVSGDEIRPWDEYSDGFLDKIKKKIFDR